MNDIIQSVKTVFEDTNIKECVTISTSLIKSGLLGSMDILAVLLNIESKGYSISNIEINDFDTVQDLIDIIKSEL